MPVIATGALPEGVDRSKNGETAPVDKLPMLSRDRASLTPVSAEIKNGGEGGIRTLGSLSTTRDFQSRTFDHSATSPGLEESS